MLNKTKIYIVDFEDSFTFNVANILYPLCNDLQVLNFKDFFEDFFESIILEDNIAVILGPGPGHPNQYSKYFNQVKKLLRKNNIYLMGICLGHQIISSQLGYEIILSTNPTHGARVSITWNNFVYCVQRYNSLAVKSCHKSDEILLMDEVMILEYENGRSYQFHPESVGTVKSLYFFKDLLSFIQIS